MRRHTIPLTLAASALALTLTGCGGSGDTAGGTPSTRSTAPSGCT